MISHRKNCFGILEEVFPVGPEGLREVPVPCFECPDRKQCMQEALATHNGIAFRRELLEREPVRGLAGWVRRWSERKRLAQSAGNKEKGRT